MSPQRAGPLIRLAIPAPELESRFANRVLVSSLFADVVSGLVG